MPAQINVTVQEEAGNRTAETMRRILTEALTNQAERYRAKARDLYHLHTRKPDVGLDAGAREYLDLATAAEQMRNQIKEA